jgi:hypothetical protein
MGGLPRLLIAGLCGSLSIGCATESSLREVQGQSFVVPAVEIVAMDAGVNYAGRRLTEPQDFTVTAQSIRRNLSTSWVVEDDPFEINQFLHPYQGAMYHGISRSSGLGYWQSAAYTLAGSLMWEIAGETTSPSKNDLIASGIAGSFLGEPLFRTARLILFRNGRRGGFLRTLGATAVSPPVGFNRLLFGDRFGSDVPESGVPADLRVELGATAPLAAVERTNALSAGTPLLGVAVDYGVPGNPVGASRRPFDYFRLEGAVRFGAAGGLDHLATRGLIAGKDFGPTVAGLFGGYDFFAPELFRVSSTALSGGASVQLGSGGSVALQGTALAGLGYTAVQAVGSSDDRDYHYAVAPQGLLSLRVVAGRRAALDVAVRQYHVGGLSGQRDSIRRGDATLALRLVGRHGVAARIFHSDRRATAASSSSETTVGLFYTFLGSGGFGARASTRTPD